MGHPDQQAGLSVVSGDRRGLWGLAVALIIALTGTLAILSLALWAGDSVWLPVRETNHVAIVGLVGLVMIFLLYASDKQKALSEREARLRHAQAREDSLRVRLAELAAVLEATTEMAQTIDLPTVVNLALRRVRVSLEADHASLMVFNPATGSLEVKAASGLGADVALQASIRPGEGVLGAIYASAESRVLTHEQECSGLSTQLRLTGGIFSAACVPLWAKGSLVGLLNVVRGGASPPLTQAHVNLLEAFGEHLAAVFLRTQYYRVLLRSSEPVRRAREEQIRQAQKMESVSRLASGIAHDFNNLLTGVVGYGNLVLSHVADQERVRRYIQEICGAGERATALTRQLLAFSSQQVLEPQVMDLNAVLTKMRHTLKHAIGKDVELTIQLAPNLGRVHADPDQIGQVIMNLVLNARDAMPDGGRITVETANAVVDEHIASHTLIDKPGPYVLLVVTDTGPGMDAETRARIFEPFFASEGCRTTAGLGLATVYGIVKQSGGHVTCYSEPSWGSSFKVYLPSVEEKRESASDGSDDLAVTASSAETVLLVEDEELVRNLTRMVLQDAGYRVIEARDGAEAISLCEQRHDPVGLLLTDVVMPIMSGPDLVRQLTARWPGLAVLYMSGYPEGAIARHGVLEAGVSFISKPFTPETLRQKVSQALAAVNADNRAPERGTAEAA